MEVKKSNTIKANNTRTRSSLSYSNKCTETKHKPKPTLNFKNCSHVCAYHCVRQSYGAQHRRVLIIFPLLSRQNQATVGVCNPAYSYAYPKPRKIGRVVAGRVSGVKMGAGINGGGLLISPDGVAPIRIVGVCLLLSYIASQSLKEAYFWHWLTWVVPEKTATKQLWCGYPPDNHHCSDVVQWKGGG